MVTIDTSVLVRFFTKDNLVAFKKVEKLLSSSEELFIPDVVFVELEHVLGKLYSASREEIAKAYQFLVGGRFLTSREAVGASSLFSKNSLSIADCFLSIYGQKGKLASFDKKLLNNSGCAPYWETPLTLKVNPCHRRGGVPLRREKSNLPAAGRSVRVM